MGDNIFISNGTCYSAAGERLHESFIPCGNAATGHQACCGAGDNCLVNGACFGVHGSGYGSWLTYQAGCTDPDYKHPSCPKKEFDQPWIALTLCDGPGEGAWAPCSQIGNPTTLQPGAFCTCTDASKTTLAFRDTSPLTSIASLPRSTGESINFFITPERTTSGGTGGSGPSNSGNPTGSATGSGTTSPGGSSQGGSGSSTGPRETGTSTPNGNDAGSSSGPSSGTKIAIGVGVTVGVLILLAAIVALFFLRRRRRRPADEIEDSSAKKANNNRASGVSSTPTMSEADGNPVSEADGTKARPWSMRSELEGSQVVKDGVGDKTASANPIHGEHAKPGELSPVAELPGNDSWYQEGRTR
ncbi:hypothetical protein B0T14DRAFT_570606 [Immersiella caudata]|uniref:Uncharacterized protein n=1 Tax=Immersiella caudata TaxID=314043 RepID=A0AA39WG05_9PEZI|nr:hypothetical protein B0T14DRAFT_570606 [Immersiella caudata]